MVKEELRNIFFDHGGDACMRAVLLFHDRRLCWRRREFSWYTTATAAKFAHAASCDREEGRMHLISLFIAIGLLPSRFWKTG